MMQGNVSIELEWGKRVFTVVPFGFFLFGKVFVGILLLKNINAVTAKAKAEQESPANQPALVGYQQVVK